MQFTIFGFTIPGDQIGWGLIHFTWQGTLIAISTAILLFLSRAAKPNIRYTLCCLALILMIIELNLHKITILWLFGISILSLYQLCGFLQVRRLVSKHASPLEPSETSSLVRIKTRVHNENKDSKKCTLIIQIMDTDSHVV